MKLTVGLTGGIGSGKTTVALAALNLVPQPGSIDAGRVIFDGAAKSYAGPTLINAGGDLHPDITKGVLQAARSVSSARRTGYRSTMSSMTSKSRAISRASFATNR